MPDGNGPIDKVMQTIVDAIMGVFKLFFTFIFSNSWITLLFWLTMINVIAIFLMKKDKEYAKEDKRRIRESTLIIVALSGGALRNVLCYV